MRQSIHLLSFCSCRLTIRLGPPSLRRFPICIETSERDYMSTSLITASDLSSFSKLRNLSTIQVPRSPHIDMAVTVSRNPHIGNRLGMQSSCRSGIGIVRKVRSDRGTSCGDPSCNYFHDGFVMRMKKKERKQRGIHCSIAKLSSLLRMYKYRFAQLELTSQKRYHRVRDADQA